MTFGNSILDDEPVWNKKGKRTKVEQIVDTPLEVKIKRKSNMFDYLVEEKTNTSFEKWFDEKLRKFETISLLTFSKLDGRFLNRILDKRFGNPIHTAEYANEKIKGMYCVYGFVKLEDGTELMHVWNCDKNKFVYDFYHTVLNVKILSYRGIVIPNYILTRYILNGGQRLTQLSLPKFYFIKKIK